MVATLSMEETFVYADEVDVNDLLRHIGRESHEVESDSLSKQASLSSTEMCLSSAPVAWLPQH